jgi:hypothetical protein
MNAIEDPEAGSSAPTGRRIRQTRLPRIPLRSILGYSRRVPPGREGAFDWLASGKEPVLTTEFVHAIALYLLLRRFAAGPQVQTLAAVLGIFGALDVPIVYMSNRWWRTQHPAPVFGGGPDSGIKDPTMLAAFGWNVLAWLAWGVLILVLRYRVERRQQILAAEEAQEALNAYSQTGA